jgi:NAD-dependent aldehyde dehydrogenases
MSELPRVTYSNTGVDFSAVETALDQSFLHVSDQLGARFGNIIGGDRDSRLGETFEVVSPLDSDIVLGTFTAASAQAIDQAVAAAREASNTWWRRDWHRRISTLRRWRGVLAERRYDLAAAAVMEIGKSRMEGVGEAEEALDLIDYYCSQMETTAGMRQALRSDIIGESNTNVMRPHGVFAVVAPFNFPLALSVNMMAAALVTGNTVVFKPAPGCGLTARWLVEAALDAGVPEGAINLVCGGDETGRALVGHKGIDGIAFTGSHDAGMSIFRQAAQGPFARPVIAEMGGKNPAYVTSSADLAVAAEGIARSAFGLQGQKCSACSVVYVEQSVHADFIAQLKRFTENLSIGDPRQRGIFMGATYSKAAADRYERCVAQARSEGVVVSGGERLSGDLFDRGFYLRPTIVDLPAASELTREEFFMPFLAVRAVQGLDAAIEEGNGVKYGLSAGIYTHDPAQLDQFLETAEAGVLYANRASGATTGAWPGLQSFCGWKGSGVTHKGGLGPNFLAQFLREQSHTLRLQ